ncbi:hypothetical protein GCM10011502_14120 [Oceanisphaera marina]|uniref:Type I restriction modification DNA specificity domain-containing protein n=1 Tax=Oceanisphaera marina TaxID=2017550 RepID=A0ABQ1IJ69_9GAMM|nr:restriction endonuclease subunit S [Oceanisphaera marina]GGB41970.1 hypothetical protein GCM10011502_14120 [Oceanisphaera marina]
MSDQVADVCTKYLVEAAKNAVPTGYKQTEVGVIPEDWQLSNIRDVSAIPMQNGLFYEPKRKGKGVPLINVGDMYTAAPVDVDSLELFNATAGEIKVFRVERGDLFFTRSSVVPSGIAYCNIFDSEREDVVFDSHLIRVRPNTEILEPRYLYLNCIAKHSRTALIAEAKTATMTTIDQGAINRCPVLVPPKKEQTAIANALSDVDALISELEKLIAKKQAIKIATMQQLLTGRTRLPQFALREDGTPKGTKPSELGEIPEDWATPSVFDLTKNIIDYRGRTPKKLGLEWGGGNIVALSAGNVKKGYIDFSAECYLGSEELYKRWMTSGEPEKGDIAFTMEAPLGNVALIPDDKKYILSQRTILLQINKERYSPLFIFQVFMSPKFADYISDSATGSTAQGIKRTTFEKMKLSIPSEREEQTAIATILSDMDEEIQALEQRLSKTRQIKQGMMQELLTGKTRLVQPSLTGVCHAD